MNLRAIQTRAKTRKGSAKYNTYSRAFISFTSPSLNRRVQRRLKGYSLFRHEEQLHAVRQVIKKASNANVLGGACQFSWRALKFKQKAIDFSSIPQLVSVEALRTFLLKTICTVLRRESLIRHPLLPHRRLLSY